MTRKGEGLVYSSKNPSPKKSAKNFIWPAREFATEETRKLLAGSLQELLAAKNWKHTDLAEKLFGFDDNGVQRKLANVRSWVKAGGPFMLEDEAGWTAELLGVSMERLLKPTKPFDPNHPMIRFKSKTGEGEYSRVAGKKAKPAPPVEDDGRWVLPHDLSSPQLKLMSSDKYPDMMVLELGAVVPQDVAMAIADMVKCRRADPPKE
jgi:hypothetical protein